MMKIKFLLGFILLFGSLSLSLRAQDTAFWFVASARTQGTAGKASSFRPAFGG
ncbi:MAG: hypothetical protein LBS88_12305 [Tannerellaceae bacterium]|jgi:hypothetical protein|nr:hypothetical protein [Tannerellaceae bacterium]